MTTTIEQDTRGWLFKRTDGVLRSTDLNSGRPDDTICCKRHSTSVQPHGALTVRMRNGKPVGDVTRTQERLYRLLDTRRP